jgi:hypothetical protein
MASGEKPNKNAVPVVAAELADSVHAKAKVKENMLTESNQIRIL